MKPVRTILLLLSMVLIASTAKAADPLAGDGGGFWICVNSHKKAEWISLVDLFEGEHEYLLPMHPHHPGASTAMFPRYMPHLSSRMPFRRPGQLSENRGLIVYDYALEWIYSHMRWFHRYIEGVSLYPFHPTLMKPVAANLRPISPELFRVVPKPETCPSGTISLLRLADFDAPGATLLRKQFWESPNISDLDKAAVVLSSVIYNRLRAEGDTNSLRARHIVAILFSKLSVEDKEKRIKEVLGDDLEKSVADGL
jgi:hypothetical protein